MARRPSRILFISHDAGRTGAPIGLLAFMQWLRTHTDFEIGTLLRAPGPLEPSFQALGPCITLGNSLLARTRLGRRLRARLPRSLREETWRVRRIFARGKYDLIYSNTMTNGGVLRALRPHRVPVVTHVHELEYWISRVSPEHRRIALQDSTSFIAVSEAVRDNLVLNHNVPREKISLVYEHIRELPPVTTPIDKASARAALGIPSDALVIGGCGAEHWRKGRDLIPQLLIALRRHAPALSTHFLWVGRSGTVEEEYTLQHDLRAAGLETRFHCSGEVENPFSLFSAIDTFALLSRDDPYPLACLEVAAMETPVVCFEGAGGIPEFVRGGCGFSVPFLDLDAMARSIIRIATNQEGARACGQRARSKVAAENTVNATGPLLRAVIERQFEGA